MDCNNEFNKVYSSPPPSSLPLPPTGWFEPDTVVFRPMASSPEPETVVFRPMASSSAPSKPKHPP